MIFLWIIPKQIMRKTFLIFIVGIVYIDTLMVSKDISNIGGLTEELMRKALADARWERSEEEHPTSAHTVRDFITRHLEEVANARRGISGGSLLTCDVAMAYRTCTGVCNNIGRPKLGSTLTPYRRVIQAAYSDNISNPRLARDGSDLPGARLVSMNLFGQISNPSRQFSHMIVAWGQFVSHDMTHAKGQLNLDCSKSCGLKGECYGIPIPIEDKIFREKGFTCMGMGRNEPVTREHPGPRDQANLKTAFIDASQIYGDSAAQCLSLAVKKTGMLLERGHPAGPHYKNLLPAERGGFCRSPDKVHMPCCYSGDHRTNQNPALLSMHTIWSHEHNRLVSLLKKLNHHWSADKLFFEARKILGAQMQHITYSEFLPLILNFETRKKYGLLLQRDGFFYGYKDSVDPSIGNEFTTAAYRFGHSLIQNQFNRFVKGSEQPITPPINTNRYFDPSFLYEVFKGGVDSIMRGLAKDSSQKADGSFAKAVQEQLVRGPGDAADLPAINIQRGRDHGIPPYTSFLKWTEHHVDTFEDLRVLMPDDNIRKLKEVYNHVDDIDLYPGGLYETPLIGSILGPTFAAIIADQFQRLRTGDRFWYENNMCRTGFTAGQLAELRKVSLARVICDNGDSIAKIQARVLELPSTGSNPVKSCASLPRIGLHQWIELPWRDVCV